MKIKTKIFQDGLKALFVGHNTKNVRFLLQETEEGLNLILFENGKRFQINVAAIEASGVNEKVEGVIDNPKGFLKVVFLFNCPELEIIPDKKDFCTEKFHWEGGERKSKKIMKVEEGLRVKGDFVFFALSKKTEEKKEEEEEVELSVIPNSVSFSNALKKASRFLSKDKKEHVDLNNVLIDFNDKGLNVVGTDGKMMAVIEVNADNKINEKKVFLSQDEVKGLIALIDFSKFKILKITKVVNKEGVKNRFIFNEGVFETFEKTFLYPDYQKINGNKNEKTAELIVNAIEVKRGLRQVSIIDAENITIEAKNEELILSAKKDDLESNISVPIFSIDKCFKKNISPYSMELILNSIIEEKETCFKFCDNLIETRSHKGLFLMTYNR